ncbi:MAG TPA: DUF4870 domain-containing protein, partial [Candidatus Woesearchaeota archaeon]|nr:DUF4870 domain-containing protein [Candidatus Woesearchaeota archaeon]
MANTNTSKTNSDERIFGILSHVLGIFTGFIGPLIIMLVAKDKMARNHAKFALNWQLSVLIYSIVAGILIIVFIGALLLAVIGVLNLIFCILAAVKASNNELWKYPLSIQFFKP